MGIARSSFYDTPAKPADDTALVEAMHTVKDEFEAYGWRRLQAALRQQGCIANHKKIKRLLREHGLQPRMRRRFVATTDSTMISRSSRTGHGASPSTDRTSCGSRT